VVEPVEAFAASVTVNGELKLAASARPSRRRRSSLLASDTAAITTTDENALLMEPLRRAQFPAAVALGGIQGDPQYADGTQSENAGTYTPPLAPGGSIATAADAPAPPIS
jgi:hypothetical protein